jgi:hypothetical protein
MQKPTRSGEKEVDAKQLVAAVALSAPHILDLEIRMTKTGTIKPHEFVGALLALTREEIKLLRVTKIHTRFHLPTEPAVSEEETKDMPLFTAAD